MSFKLILFCFVSFVIYSLHLTNAKAATDDARGDWESLYADILNRKSALAKATADAFKYDAAAVAPGAGGGDTEVNRLGGHLLNNAANKGSVPGPPGGIGPIAPRKSFEIEYQNDSCARNIACDHKKLHQHTCCSGGLCCVIAANLESSKSCSTKCSDKESCCPVSMCCSGKETSRGFSALIAAYLFIGGFFVFVVFLMIFIKKVYYI